MRLRLLLIISLVSLALLASFSVVVAQERGTPGGATDNGGAVQPVFPLAPVGSGFTYQGQLKNGGNPVNGTCDLQFRLFDALAGGAQVGATQTIPAVSLVNGVFTVVLNSGSEFGPAFTGEERFLAIAVRCPAGGGSYTPLTPRQRLSAAPYAFSLKPEAVINGAATGSEANPDGGVLKVKNNKVGTCDYAAGVRATQGTGATGTQFCDNVGVFGSGSFNGVLGSGDTYGVGGVSQTDTGWGVYARADGLHGAAIYANTWGSQGENYGIYAINYSTIITGGYGIYGIKGSRSGYDLLENYWFPGAVVGDSNIVNGVIGLASGGAGIGVLGIITGTADRAVAGYALAANDYSTGVEGSSNATYGVGVYGSGTGSEAFGVYGYSYQAYGVYGSTGSTDGFGVVGVQTGYNTDDLGGFWAPGGFFGGRNGIVAVTKENGGYGVAGVYDADTGYGAAVRGRSNSPNAYGVYGVNNAGGYAGYFDGDVYVTGNLGAGGAKPFRIDYPLDPANKYLYHYAVESPQVQNQYNGTVTLDANGEAVVDLPVYFSAVNAGPFQYQLTAIGAPGPNLYIAQEVTGNQFKIAGGAPGMKVSWLLFGLRNDPWIRDHPQTDVADKPAGEVGTYVYPQGYGQPATLQLGFLEQTNSPQQPAQLPPMPSTQNSGASGSTQAPQQPGAVPGSSTYPPQP
jgi:hypothetical protein